MSVSVKKNFFFSSILTVANYVFPLLTYPYVSRVLGVTNIGICNFVDSIVQYFIMFSMLGTVTVGIRAIAQNKDNQITLNRAFNSVFFLNTMSTFIVLVVFILFYLLTPKMHSYLYLMIFGAFKIIFNYLQIEWFYKGMEDFKYITFRTLTIKCIYVLSVFLLVKESTDYSLYYLLTVLMIVVNALVNIRHARIFVNYSLCNLEIKKYIKPFLILGIDLFCGAMYTTFNVAYLGFVTNDEQVGYYTTATKLYYICLSIYTAFTGVMIPRMSSLCANGDFNQFKSMLVKSYHVLFVFSIPVVVYVTLNADMIIRIIAGNGYNGAIVPLKIIMPLMCILGYKQVIILQGFLPLNKNKAILANSAIGAIISLFFGFFFVQKYYAVGTAFVWVVAEFAGMLLSQFLIKRYINLSFPVAFICKMLFAYIPMGVGLYFLSIYAGNIWLRFFSSCLFSLIYFLILNIVVFKDVFVINIMHSIINRLKTIIW